MQLLLEPILAVDVAGDDEGDDVVTCCVHHRGGRIDEVAEGNGYRVGDGLLIREEDGADNKLARTAAAGNAGHRD